MKAITFNQLGGPEVLKLDEVPKPELKPGKVLVKNRAIGVNFADILFRQGQYVTMARLPDSPGLEGAGVVEAVGEGVENIKPGDRVAYISVKTYAEYALAPAAQVIPIPDFMSFEEGAAFPIQVLTAYHMLNTTHRTTPDQVVLVHSAAGGVGLVAVQIAKSIGAHVIGTVSSESKAELVKAYGADAVINYATHDFAAEAMRITNNRGVDLILDAVGEPTLKMDLRCMAPFGHLIVYGRAGGAPEPLNLFALFEKSLTVSGFVLYTVSSRPQLMRQGIEATFQLMRGGRLRLLIGDTFPLEQAADAHRSMESRQSVGKLLLIP
ncbi:MAG: quinone oxidoreductase [Candidatus Binataceae bacterium]